MAALTIFRAPICSDPANEVKAEQWPELIAERRKFCTQILPADCRMLLFFVDDAEKSDWMGFESRDDYLRDGLGLNPKQVKWATIGLKRMRPSKPVAYNDAIKVGKQGGDRRSQAFKDQVSNAHLKGTGSIERTLACLDRDGHDNLAAQVRAGEISANAAAIKVGYRKKPKKRCPACGHEWR